MVTISEPGALHYAWQEQYRMLAKKFAGLLPKNGIIVEIGSGRGQLTIPLAKLVKNQMLAIDSFDSPYSGARPLLLAALSKEKLKGQISVFKEDYRDFLRRHDDGRFEAVISSEFLPEIDSTKTREFLSECHRVLGKGGASVHSFLSPVPTNLRQRLLIEADTNPKWTKTPPEEWFSPTQNLVTRELRLVGFKHVRGSGLKSHLIVKGMAAEQMLRDWEIRKTFWNAHKTFLTSQGLEIPDWILCAGWKL